MSNPGAAQSHWLRISTWLAALLGAFQIINAFRAFADPSGFADYIGLPLTDPANKGFVLVYALRAAFIGLFALALLLRRDVPTMALFALVALLMPLGDAILTASNGAPVLIVGRHAATAIVVAVTAALLFMRVAEQTRS